MSTNQWLSVEVRHVAPAKEAAVREAITTLLVDEGLASDFYPRNGLRHVMRMALVDGGLMLHACSDHPVIIAGSSSRFVERLDGALKQRATQANGGACDALFRATDGDELLDAPFERCVHAVENLRVDEVEGLRGRGLAPILDALLAHYDRLPAWEQRDEMFHLLCDQPADRLRALCGDILRAPPASDLTPRHYAHAHALAVLLGPAAAGENFNLDVARTARLVDRVRKGQSVADALAAERGGTGPSLLRAAPSYKDADAPAYRKRDALLLSWRHSDVIAELEDVFEKRGWRTGGLLWRELLRLHCEARGLLDRWDSLLPSASPEELRLDNGLQWIVEELRALVVEGPRLEELVPRASAVLAEQEAAYAKLDPLFALPWDALLDHLDKSPPTPDELLRLARHPESYVHEALLDRDYDLPDEAMALLKQSSSQRVRGWFADD